MNSLPQSSDADASAMLACAHRESLASFLQFAAKAIGIESQLKGGVLELAFEAAEHPGWPKPYHVSVAVEAQALEKRTRRQIDPAAGAAWLWERALLAGAAIGARPAKQPDAVHEFSDRMFQAYQVDAGQIHLAGCHLTDVPFVRLTFLGKDDPTEVEHFFLTAEGLPVSPELLEELRLADVRTLGDHPPACGRRATESILQRAETSLASRDLRFIAATLIGAKWADGSLQFDIADQSAPLEFSGWTTTLSPPPFHCDASGFDTFHVAAIDDGRIVAAEAIATCEESGKKVLACEMETCCVTGKKVDGALTAACPVTGDPALATEFAECSDCLQKASKKGLVRGVCGLCRSMERLPSGDPRRLRLTKQYPALAKFRQFRQAESDGVSRLEAIGSWRRILVVTEQEGDKLLAVATRSRFSSRWQQVPKADWPALLGNR